MHKIIELLMVSKLMVKVESSSSRCVFLEYSYISNCWGATLSMCCSCLIDSDLSKSRLFWFRISISFFLPFTHEPPYIATNTAFVTSVFVTQNHCHFVKYKSLEKLISNKFQVKNFEIVAKKCLKVNRFSLLFWNYFFQFKIMIIYFQKLQYLEYK